MSAPVAAPSSPPRVSRSALLIVGVPPLAALVLLLVFLVVERVVPLSLPPAATVADAAARGAAARAVRLILEGADPNQSGAVPPGVLSPDAYELHPVDAAVLGRHREMITLLMRHGMRIDNVERSACLAAVTGFSEALPVLGVNEMPMTQDRVGPAEAWQRCRERGR